MGINKVAILRFINYKDADEYKFKKVLGYITSPSSAPIELQKASFINIDNALSGMKIINDRWDPKGKRMFKHGIFSFGKSDLKAEEARRITDDILNFYDDKYPIISSVHTNIPNRIHSHFIMGMVNFNNGKKFEQSPQELRRFKDHFNEVVHAKGLPTLKGFEITKDLLIEAEDPEFCSNFQCNMPYYAENISCDNQVGMNYYSVINPIKFISNEIDRNMTRWYKLGRGDY